MPPHPAGAVTLLRVERFRLDPETYMNDIRAELPRYEELQDAVAEASREATAERVLELGVGTGETGARILAAKPTARLTAIDRSPDMVERARARLPSDRVEDIRVGHLEDPLPPGPFDLVVSALVVHHLDSAGKRDLFRRVAEVVPPGGRFVLGDVFVPMRPEDAITPLEPGVDLPDPVKDQLDWLREAGFEPDVRWAWKDVAVVACRRT